MQARNRDLIRDHGLSVWLDCNLETLWHRVRQRSTRPLLQTSDPRGTLAELLEKRAPTYALADLTFTSRHGDSIEQSAIRLIDALRDRVPELLQESR